MKYLECRYYEDVPLNNFHRWLNRYEVKHGFHKQRMEYVPIKYMRRDGTYYIPPKPYDWRDYDVRGDL